MATQRRSGELLSSALRATATVVAMFAVPMLLGFFFAGVRGTAVACAVSVFTALAGIRAGWGIALALSPLSVAVTTLMPYAAQFDLFAALSAGVIALAVGFSTRFGVSTPIALIGASAVGTAPISADLTPGVNLVLVSLSALWAILVMKLFGLPKKVSRPRQDLVGAIAAGVTFLIVMCVGYGVALWWGNAHSYWLPMLLFVFVAAPSDISATRHAWLRALGASAAVVAMVPLIALSSALPYRIGLILIFMVATVAVDRPIWLNSLLGTMPLLLALTSASTSPIEYGVPRLIAALLAALLLAGGFGVIQLLNRVRAPH